MLERVYLAVRKRILLAFRGRYFVADRGGLVLLVDILAYIDRRCEAFGGYEKPLMDRLLEHVSALKADLFIDVGANIGLYCINARLRYPDTRVMAFEPDTRNLSHLYANLFLNDVQDSIEVYPTALSDHRGELRFRRHNAENPGRSGVFPEGDRRVEVMPLDDILPVDGQRCVIKIDVEGHELSVLKGMSTLLQKNECIVQVEAFEPAPVFDFFLPLGYHAIFREGSDFIFSRSSS